MKQDSVSIVPYIVPYSDLRVADSCPSLKPPTGVKHHAHKGELAQNNCMQGCSIMHVKLKLVRQLHSGCKILVRSCYHSHGILQMM